MGCVNTGVVGVGGCGRVGIRALGSSFGSGVLGIGLRFSCLHSKQFTLTQGHPFFCPQRLSFANFVEQPLKLQESC